MAFFSKVANILRQTTSNHIGSNLSSCNPSIFQAIRCMSSSKLFIGGLSYSTDDTSLREAFSSYGQVLEARIITDRETGRSRGFGFITYSSAEEASSAIQALDGQELHGRQVRVNYATDRARGGGFGGGGYSGGYGGGGGGYGGYGSGGYGGGGYGGGGGAYGGGGYNNGATEGSGGGTGFGTTGDYGGGSTDPAAAAGSTGLASGGYDGSNNVDPLGEDGFTRGSPLEGNYRDEDEPDDYAKRA